MKISKLAKHIAAVALMMACAATIALADTQHVVKKNESLYGIAYQYNISAEDLLKANPQARNGLRQGMVLTIPGTHGSYGHPEEVVSEPVQAVQEAASTTNESASTAIEEVLTTPISTQEVAATPISSEEIAATPSVEASSATVTTEENVSNQAIATSAQDGTLYFVKNGDTMKSISQATGLSMTALMELNPFVDPYALVPGTPIRLTDDAPLVELGYIGDNGFSAPEGIAALTDYPITNLTTTYPVEATEEIGDYPGDFFSDSPFIESALGTSRHKIMVMLPFMSNSETQSKQAQQYTEFYRGMLLAANELSEDNGMSVEIIAIDLHNDAHRLAQALTEQVDTTISVIIAPEEDSFLQAIIDYSTPQGVYVYNAFNLKDENYLSNGHVLQGYINQDIMYQKAIKAIAYEFPDYSPIILSPAEGRTEKDPFVTALREQYEKQGIPVYDLEFEGTLTAKAVQEAEFIQPDGKYVFIPRSGALGVFNRFAPAIVALKEADEDTDRFAVFGYPDWTAFRGDALNLLYKTNAVIYTRFFHNEASVEAKDLQQEYQKWYGEKMRETIPVQGVLGYDTGAMLIGWLQDSEGQLQQMLDGGQIKKGVQSSFGFDHGNGYEGYVNNRLYIVKFLPSGTTYSKVI